MPSSRCFGTQVSGDDISQSVVLADRDDHFLVSTDSNLGDCRVTKVIGIVSAGHVRSRSLPADLWTAIGGMFGGEASMYSHLANETCTQAIDSAVHQAKVRGIPTGQIVVLHCVCARHFLPVPHAVAGLPLTRRNSAPMLWWVCD